MVEEVNNAIVHGILEERNQKIKKGETLEQYLKSFQNDDLTRMCVFKTFMSGNLEDIIKIHDLAHKSKKTILNFIELSFHEVWGSILRIVSKEMFDFYKELVASNGILEISFSSKKLSLLQIMIMKNFALTKVEYNQSKEIIKFFIPEEFKREIEKGIKDTNILEENNRNNAIYDMVIGLLEAYGVMDFEKMYERIEKEYLISYSDFDQIMGAKALIDEIIQIHYVDANLKLISSIEFDEEEALELFKKQKGTYKKFTKKEIESLQNGTYVKKLKSYKNFIHYLKENFEDFSNNEIIDSLLIMDYITIAQTDVKEAKENFLCNVEDFFEVDQKEKEEMLTFIQAIFDEYPKWKKRGNC